MLRRSDRKTKAKLLKAQEEVWQASLSKDNDYGLGLEVTMNENEGRGVKVLSNIIECLISHFVYRR